MTSDRTQFNAALRKWDALHAAGAYSVPSDEGHVAILWSDYEMDTELLGGAEADAYEQDAHEVAADLESVGIESHIFPAYTLQDVRDVLAHPIFSSIVTIGNGDISAAYTREKEEFDWKFVSDHSVHLKTGRFTQRHCGHTTRPLSVPLGTFGMTEHSSVYAAYDHILPTVMTDKEEQLIKQLHTRRRLGYRAVKKLFRAEPEAKSDKDHDN